MTFVDVTELKTAQNEVSRLNQELNRRLAEMETLLDLVPVGISIAEDTSCETIRVNHMGARLLGSEEGGNVSKSYAGEGAAAYLPLQNGREVEADKLPMQRSCHTGVAVEAEEYTIRRPDGTEVDVLMSASPLFDEDGEVRGAVGAFTDVSRSRRDREELERRSRQQAMVVQLGLLALQSPALQEVFDTAVEGIREVLEVDFSEILEVLPEGDEMLLRAGHGWSDGLVGSFRVPAGGGSRAGFTLASNKPVVMEDLEHEERFTSSRLLSDHGVVSGISVAIPGRDRRWGVLGVHDTRHREFDPVDVDFVLAVANVVTAAVERERAERRLRETEAELTESQTRDRLRRSERLASIGILAAGIAHEINNPINSILMTADAGLSIPGRTGEPERVAEDLGIILQEAERCGSIINNVLTFSRETSTQKEHQNLNVAVRQGLQLVAKHAKQHQAELRIRLTEDLPAIDLNVTELEQVIVNLVQNAIESGGDGVTIGVETRLRKGRVELVVSDDGPGMSEDVLHHIFDPFFTTRREHGGTGLGLSLVFTIVREHGGEIDVRSAPGKGTTFRIEFPAPES
jgi:signal transduction histidine kinase